MFRTIQMCIFGSPEEKTSLEEGPYRTAGSLESTETGDTSMYHSCLKLVFCVINLQVNVVLVCLIPVPLNVLLVYILVCCFSYKIII